MARPFDGLGSPCVDGLTLAAASDILAFPLA